MVGLSNSSCRMYGFASDRRYPTSTLHKVTAHSLLSYSCPPN